LGLLFRYLGFLDGINIGYGTDWAPPCDVTLDGYYKLMENRKHIWKILQIHGDRRME